MASPFQKLFKKSHDHQTDMLTPMRERTNVFLKAPCGSGKTEAVVVPWLAFRPTSRLIYALPTGALLEATHRRITAIAEKMDIQVVRPEERVFGEKRAEKISVVRDYHVARETTLLMHDVIITTLDSLIARLYRTRLTRKRYRDLTTGRILNSTVVLDEAHMYDNYTQTLSKYTLHLLRETSTHHVVMTATMNDGLQKYLAINGANYQIVQTAPQVWDSFTGSRTLTALHDCAVAEIPQIIKQIVENTGVVRALIVMNTVARAQEVAKILPKDQVLLVHSRYKPQDRKNKNHRVIEEFQTASDGFLVATQVVEAGMDISVPLLVTEIAHGDSLVQRLGRCARRPGENGEVHLLMPRYQKGESRPYQRAQIDQVAKSLRPRIGKAVERSEEQTLVETVVPPQISDKQEARARSIIVDAFDGLAAYAQSWSAVPTRSTIPLSMFCGDKQTLAQGTLQDILNSSVGISSSFLRGLLMKGFQFQSLSPREWRDEDRKALGNPKGKGKEVKSISDSDLEPWSVVIPVHRSSDISYDADWGLGIK
ncbi:MAG: CRISPR-associated helicase Cas3' [Candidatus Heimdallarchaeota archaeon]